jgi:hypothetical protein
VQLFEKEGSEPGGSVYSNVYFYYIVSMIGENFAREGVWEPTLTMWFSTFFFLIISIFMTYQAVADTFWSRPMLTVKY